MACRLSEVEPCFRRFCFFELRGIQWLTIQFLSLIGNEYLNNAQGGLIALVTCFHTYLGG